MALRFDSRKTSKVFVELLTTIREEQGEKRSQEFAVKVRDAMEAKVVSELDLPTYWLTAPELRKIAAAFVRPIRHA